MNMTELTKSVLILHLARPPFRFYLVGELFIRTLIHKQFSFGALGSISDSLSFPRTVRVSDHGKLL